jgi:hypothetical protein
MTGTLSPLPLLLLTVAAAALLVTLCFFTHLAVMERLSRRVYRSDKLVAHPVRLVLFGLFAAHLVEVLFYAVVLSLFDWAGFGTLAGDVSHGPGWFIDHFYFSIASYTTLGIGDIVPQGALRLLVGIEALNGLVLVAWSASFTYLVMERCWGTGQANDETR